MISICAPMHCICRRQQEFQRRFASRACKILGEITRPLTERDHRCWGEAWMTTAEGGLERVVQHRGTHVEKGLHSRPVPAHLLSLVHALGHDLVNRTLDERGRDRLTTSTPGGIMHQHILVALEVAEKVTDVSLKTVDADDPASMLTLRPAQ